MKSKARHDSNREYKCYAFTRASSKNRHHVLMRCRLMSFQEARSLKASTRDAGAVLMSSVATVGFYASGPKEDVRL